MNKFDKKVVIVTGATSGIGLAIAWEFAKLGSKVVLAARNEVNLNSIENEIRTAGYEVLSVKTDVSKVGDCENLIKKTIEKYQGIDILINNAGISMRALFKDADLEVLHKLMDVNFWGTVNCTKFALSYILKNKGSVVGISSIAGLHGLPGRSAYSASKFAMNGFMESIRVENLRTGMHVLMLYAGFVNTSIRKRALLSDGSVQGFTPREEEKMMSPEKVAKILIRSIKRRKRNKILTLEGQLITVVKILLPFMVDRGAYKKFAKEPDSPFK